jgi:hypothetical protein
MTLGPTPEFCLQSREAVALPDPIAAQHIALRRVWPTS